MGFFFILERSFYNFNFWQIFDNLSICLTLFFLKGSSILSWKADLSDPTVGFLQDSTIFPKHFDKCAIGFFPIMQFDFVLKGSIIQFLKKAIRFFPVHSFLNGSSIHYKSSLIATLSSSIGITNRKWRFCQKAFFS